MDSGVLIALVVGGAMLLVLSVLFAAIPVVWYLVGAVYIQIQALVVRAASTRGLRPARDHLRRVSVAIQLTSQVLPPSTEKACSKCAESGVMPEMTKRTRMSRPSNVSWL